MKNFSIATLLFLGNGANAQNHYLNDKEVYIDSMQSKTNNAKDGEIIYSEQMEKKRKLFIQFNDERTKSNECNTKCISEGKNFCANANFSGGYCCDLDEECPRAELCSNDNPRAP